MTNVTNISQSSVASRGFLPLAIEAGIEAVVESIVSGLALDITSLTIATIEAIEGTNKPLSEALRIDTMSAIVDYMYRSGSGIQAVSGLPTPSLPILVNTAGPVSVSAAFDGGTPTQVNITFSESPDAYTDYEIYLDGVYQKTGNNVPAGGFVNDSISDVAAGAHTIRVLYLTTDEEQTLFGPVANFS
jgi:hypothetical protein